MKFSDILGFLKPAASIAASFIPGGAAAVELVNAFLPDEEKLPPTATGGQVVDAYNSLPPEDRASIREKEIELELAQEEGWTERYKSMCAADGQSTRPKIALLMAYTFSITYYGIGVAMAWAISSGMVELNNMWPTLLAYLGVPMGILNKYFGELRKEQGNRMGIQEESLLSKLFGGSK